jgi:hypothetical protein
MGGWKPSLRILGFTRCVVVCLKGTENGELAGRRAYAEDFESAVWCCVFSLVSRMLRIVIYEQHFHLDTVVLLAASNLRALPWLIRMIFYHCNTFDLECTTCMMTHHWQIASACGRL